MDIYFLFFCCCSFYFFFPKSHQLFWILPFISPSFSLKKNTFHQKTRYSFLLSLPANYLALSRRVSRINKLTFRKITKVQVGCLRGESLNIRWSIRLQRVSIKVTVQAAFACPGKVCVYRQHRVGSRIHPGQGALVPHGRVLHCQGCCCCCCCPPSCKQLRRVQTDKFDRDSSKIWERGQISFLSHPGWSEGARLGPAVPEASPNAPRYPSRRESRIRPTTFPTASLNPVCFYFFKKIIF